MGSAGAVGRLGRAVSVVGVAALGGCGARTGPSTAPPRAASTDRADSAALCKQRAKDNDSVVIVPAEQRYTPQVTRFSEVRSSIEAPVEVCEARSEAEYLFALRCDDGSAPFATVDQADAARIGNVGPGGRCGSTIDRYDVQCPNAKYEIYMDLYMCSPGDERQVRGPTTVTDRGITVTVPQPWLYASGGTPELAFVLTGPSDLRMAAGSIPGTSALQPGEIAALFAAVGIAQPPRIANQDDTEHLHFAAFEQVGDTASAALSRVDGNVRRVVLIAGPGSHIPDATEAVLMVIASMRANDHEYVDLQSLIDEAEGGDVPIRTIDVEGRTLPVPAGWNVVVRGSSVQASLADEQRGRLAFGRSEIDAQPGMTPQNLCQQILAPSLMDGAAVAIVYSGAHDDGRRYLIVADHEDNRFVITVRKNPDGSYTAFFMLGPAPMFKSERALILLLALATDVTEPEQDSPDGK